MKLKQLAILFFSAFLLAWSTIPAYAEGPGAIEGQIANGTPGGGKPGDFQVTLHVYQNGQELEEKTATADAAGRFRFGGLETDQAFVYQVSTSYQAVDFYAPDIVLSDSPNKEIELKIYEVTDNDQVLKISLQSFVIGGGTPKGDMVVLEVFTIANEGDRAFVGSEDTSGGPPKMLRFSLPPEAQDTFLHQGPPGAQILEVDTGFALKAPIPPGNTDVSFAYRLPYSSEITTISKSILYPTESFQVVIPDDNPIQATSSALTVTEKREVEGKQYRFYIGHDLKVGNKVSIALSGMSAPSPLETLGSAVPPMSAQGAAAVGGALILGVVLVYALARKRPSAIARQPTATRRPSRLKATPREDMTPRRSRPARGTSLRVEREKLLLAMAELDEDYEEGKVPENDYEKRRSEIKGQLMEMTRQLRGETQKTP